MSKENIVLVSAQPGAVQDLAVGTFGRGGNCELRTEPEDRMVGEDENLIRWDIWRRFRRIRPLRLCVFETAARISRAVGKGEKIMLHAGGEGGAASGKLRSRDATIPGADPKLKEEEIAFSCHWIINGRERNDNASGCVTILEAARTLQKLISEGKLARPARTIRFIFPRD